MSPKPARQLINISACSNGLAGHYQWEKEVLVDYIASRFLLIIEDVEEDAEAFGISHKSDYTEMLQISAALRKHPNSGMSAKIELGGTFGDLRDFVEWSKEELADYLIHQIIRCDLGAVFESRMGQWKAAEEIVGLAVMIYLQQNEDGYRKAESDARDQRAFRDARRAEQAARSVPAPQAPSPARVKAARARATV